MHFRFDNDFVYISPLSKKNNPLISFFSKKSNLNIQGLIKSSPDLGYAYTALKSIAEECNEQIVLKNNEISFSHLVLSKIDEFTAKLLGLPQITHLTFKTDTYGVVGSDGFSIKYQWSYKGIEQFPKRTGAILETSKGIKRIPSWILEAIELLESQNNHNNLDGHWDKLALFSLLLKNEENNMNIQMSDFLQGLEINVANQFSISITDIEQADFQLVPFYIDDTRSILSSSQEQSISERNSLLDRDEINEFNHQMLISGTKKTYRLSKKKFIVINECGKKIINEIMNLKNSPKSQRYEFIQNPLPFFTKAIASFIDEKEDYLNYSDFQIEELTEQLLTTMFIETTEYSERVKGIIKHDKTHFGAQGSKDIQWIPEIFPNEIIEILDKKTSEELLSILDEMHIKEKSNDDNLKLISIDGVDIEVNDENEELIKELIRGKRKETTQSEPITQQTIILSTKDNFDSLNWIPKKTNRKLFIEENVPSSIKTTLKPHQIDSFKMQLKVWKFGYPGILNADEQGLGKTLQTISFLKLIQNNNKVAIKNGQKCGPILIVAPTTLLENWISEVENHLTDDGLGFLVKCFGKEFTHFKQKNIKGIEIEDGTEKLDLTKIHEIYNNLEDKPIWLLTTYTTLTNYQHSFAKLKFSIAVFDEIQALKNPASLRALAAKAINSDFRIGLTGTPIENNMCDLWAIMDQLNPASLGTLNNFKDEFKTIELPKMQELYQILFNENSSVPPLGIRRLKVNVASDLPKKTRLLYPQLMPKNQELAYNNVLKLNENKKNSSLITIQQIRGISIHPTPKQSNDLNEFINSSARLMSTIQILKEIKAKNEKALVFIEHYNIQNIFKQLAESIFDIESIDIINGKTPIHKRQEIVNKFQRYMGLPDDNFAILILSPKAAGTGLTLTAANHVIHLSRWWNPAVEEQCNDRTHRIGQSKNVYIHIPIAIHEGYLDESFDCLLQILMSKKRLLSKSTLWPESSNEDDAKWILSGQQKPISNELDKIKYTMSSLFRHYGEKKGIEIAKNIYEID